MALRSVRSRSKLIRSLQVERLETRYAFAVDLTIDAPVIAAFEAQARLSGLDPKLSSQPATVHTVDSNAVRNIVTEQEGVLYSFSGDSVFLTEAISEQLFRSRFARCRARLV